MTKPDYITLDFPSPAPDRPYVYVNMVMSVDGKVVVDGTEKGIGSKVDQRLMRELRVSADVVLNGAETLRRSGTSSRLHDPVLEMVRKERGLPPCPIAAVLSRSGDLPLERLFFTADDFRAVVYLSSMAPVERREALEATGRQVVVVPQGAEIAGMLRHMREELGAKALLCEGGPTVNSELFRAGAVDEFFLTLGPVVVAGRDSLTAVEGATAFSLADLKHLDLISAVPNPETSEVYLRYRVRR